jgi:hypothetical protein
MAKAMYGNDPAPISLTAVLTAVLPAVFVCALFVTTQNMAKAMYGNDPAPIPCSAFNSDGTIYAYALSYDWSRGFQVRAVTAAGFVVGLSVGRTRSIHAGVAFAHAYLTSS